MLAVGAHWNDVALGKMLQFRDDAPGAVVAEVVQEVVAVPASSSHAYLDEPRPHRNGCSGDRDGAGGVEGRTLDEIVAGQRTKDFRWSSTPCELPGANVPAVDHHCGRDSEHKHRLRSHDASLRLLVGPTAEAKGTCLPHGHAGVQTVVGRGRVGSRRLIVRHRSARGACCVKAPLGSPPLLYGLRLSVESRVVGVLELRRRDHSKSAVQAPAVVPVDRPDALVGKAVRERDGRVLRPGVRVADQLASYDRIAFAAALPQRHSQGHVDQFNGLVGATFQAAIFWANSSWMKAT